MKVRMNAGLIIFFIASAILLSVTVSGEKVIENSKSTKGGGNLNPGVVLLGAESKQGFDRFKYMLRDRLIQGFAFFPFGWGPITPEEGVYNWDEMDEVVKNAKEQDEKIAAAFWSAGHSYEHSPQWLYYKYNLRLITSQGAFVNFENSNLYRGSEQKRIGLELLQG